MIFSGWLCSFLGVIREIGWGARTARINGVVSLPAITAGLSCKRNTDEEPDISQLIEEKSPTRSPASPDSHMGIGTAGSAVNARGPNSGAFACAMWIAA